MSARGVRVTGGAWRGRLLAVGPGVRPTEGRVREALFSIWQGRLPGARVLDLFAGSGAVGIEAMSRGAASVLFCEQSPVVLRVLEENAALVERGARQIRRGALPRALRALAEHPDRRFDLVFADPPYGFADYAELLETAAVVLADGGELAVEHSSRVEVPAAAGALRLTDARRYGESALSFFRAAGETAASERQEEGDRLEVDAQVDVLDPHTGAGL